MAAATATRMSMICMGGLPPDTDALPAGAAIWQLLVAERKRGAAAAAKGTKMPPPASERADAKPAAAANSLFVSAQDGLRLHVRAYGARTNRALPVVCLPGLARTT